VTVDDSPQDTIGMIRSRRWADWVPPFVAGAIIAVAGWKAGMIFVALWITLRLEVNRVLAAIWPECYHAVRKPVEDDRELPELRRRLENLVEQNQSSKRPSAS
jgi:hypothetical protein